MENQEQQPRKSKWILIFVSTICLLAGILIAVVVGSTSVIMDKNSELKFKDSLLLREQLDKTTCIYKRDSMAIELNRLAIYKTLTSSMVYRDEVLMGLEHKVGDRVILKRDSLKATVVDIVIGGSKYDFHIHYRVNLDKDDSYEEIIPERIY